MKFLWMILLLMPSLGFSADYKHCIKYWNTSRDEELTRGFFTLDEEGKVNVAKMRGDAKYSKSPDGHEFKLPWGDIEVGVIVKTQNDRPVEVIKTFKQRGQGGEISRVSFGMKDDICFPKKQVFKDTKYKGFDMGLCRDLVEYLAKNPEAKTCECGTERSSAEIQKIFGKYPHAVSENTSNSSSRKMEASAELVSKMADQPLRKAFHEMSRCSETAGLGDAVSDANLWGKAAPKDPNATLEKATR